MMDTNPTSGTSVHPRTVDNPSPVERRARRRDRFALLLQGVGFCLVACVVSYSAMMAKEMQVHNRMAALARIDSPESARVQSAADLSGITDPLTVAADSPRETAVEAAPAPATARAAASDLRWFNGRLVRPAKQITMKVTGYSPDERSCGASADGITASLHSVETNSGKLVAADPKVLPLGSIVSVPGYADGKVVPVLDVGGKIKGNRLDLLYPTDRIARQWGVKTLTVTVWEYADGKPAPDWRKIRDSK